ncbi:hypothetical protein [Granulicella sibirica]|uniref:Type II toxin-antitoxin system ParD family antitoxin n=1 Tax=Granulicella sibirica TaxID=2479048 RepID=A0A4Q0SYQ7_9BACT|nr:hypothetical protein [Granulicella sibirica]RXH54176.1 hypothetical protein GRAN_4827 [Granulicella sibirica]
MTIEIHQPELEAMIQQRIDSGAFQNVEDVLLHAMKALPAASARASSSTGAKLVAAMQSSPARDISLEPARVAMPVRDAAL